MFDRGAITINQYLELMYYPPIEGGDVRMVSLNYVKVDDQSLYQTGKDDDATGGETPPAEDPPGNTGNPSANIKARIKEVCSYGNI